MKNKFLALIFLFTLLIGGVAFLGSQTTNAQTVTTTFPDGCSSSAGYSLTTGESCSSTVTATFPAGCSSALGYSVTTGMACSGTTSVIPRFLPGCTTALGYSITNGVPCSGSSVALEWLAGCTSTYGYSTIDNAPCNGTTVATSASSSVVTPGFPTTGEGGNAPLNILILISSAIVATLGFAYLARDYYRKSV